MQIKITNRFTSDGKEFFEWDLADGPDGIDHAHGYATDLITAFSKLIEWHDRISADYATELESNSDNTRNSLANNETDPGTTN